jgi:hypothetical protein
MRTLPHEYSNNRLLNSRDYGFRSLNVQAVKEGCLHVAEETATVIPIEYKHHTQPFNTSNNSGSFNVPASYGLTLRRIIPSDGKHADVRLSPLLPLKTNLPAYDRPDLRMRNETFS